MTIHQTTRMMKTRNTLEDTPVNVKLKLAVLWASLMPLYIYVDYFHLYMPNMVADLLKGRVFVFDITQGFLLAALVSMSIPTLMIFLSIALPAHLNRWTNIIVATIFIPYTLFNLTGEVWIHMVYGAVIEVVLLGLIIHYAWKWPRMDKSSR